MRATTFTFRPLRSAAVFAALLLSTAAPLIAQPPASPTSAEPQDSRATIAFSTETRLEYALYVGEGLGGRRSFATATRTIAGRNWQQFAERLRTPPFPEYPSTEPAFFNWLGERGWELVGCQRHDEIVGLLGDRDIVTRCYFRRVVGVHPEDAPAPTDSLRGSVPSGRTTN